ncbi:MAG: DNA-directed RNA polymerase subunit L [Candidatus Brockarchaeota archaeon]|nr:DNA-directed RNA polymerase subunit L [Candidatus Brockarchaeota archaeon]
MEEAVVKKLSANELEIEFVGEGHTFYNLIKEYLLLDERVLFAAYKVEHPLSKKAKLYVRAKRQPETAVSEAAAKLAKDAGAVAEFFERLGGGKA